MTIPTQGPVKFSDIQTTYGGSNPISLSEYYRGGANVPAGVNTGGIPASGAIDLEDFRGTSPNAVITYEIIGGGGAGGYGLEDGFGSGNAQSGASSSITGTGVSITVTGGTGGANGNISGNAGGSTGGQASVYGPGGAAVGNGSVGRSAPATSYGAAGGGAGGDSSSIFDSSGASGSGGFAGQRTTGSLLLRYTTSLTITIGAGGIGSGGVRPGGNGASGYAKLIVDGTTHQFTSSGTLVI